MVNVSSLLLGQVEVGGALWKDIDHEYNAQKGTEL